MKIAFYNIFGETKNAEQEEFIRLQYVFSKMGHELFTVDRDGHVTDEGPQKGRHVEQLGVDFLFTYNCLDMALSTLFDCFSVFLHWAPVGFFENYKSLLYLKSLNLYDAFACTYESDIFERVVQIPAGTVPLFGSSVPADYVIAPKKLETRKIFYTGINFERQLSAMRYGELLGELDKTGQLDIYGPTKVYSRRNLWAGFKSYKGEIPFDGKSIIEKISQAGVCLALNSPMHSDAGGVSNRTYEGAAAGAVIISDDNAFVHKYFGDSVFYIDRDMSEKEAPERIVDILRWVNDHPDEAYDMACRSQQAFLEHLTLDKMASDFVESTEKAMARVRDRSLQKDLIDVVCFVDEAEDWPGMLSHLERQYYQELHLVIVADEGVYKKLVVPYSNDFVQRDWEFKGRSFVKARERLQGRYFMFMDRHTVMHARHIYKNHEVLSGRDELFAYSGSYLKRPVDEGKRYIVLNNGPILRDEFLLFAHVSGVNADWYYRDQQCFHIETIFAQSAALFDKEILAYAEDEELSMVSEAVHYYLACCSLVKAERLGRFTYALTTGYSGNSVEEMSREVFGYSRRHWYSNGRSAKTYIKEMNEIFFKYNFESYPRNLPVRSFLGETTWADETETKYRLPFGFEISNKSIMIQILKKITPYSLRCHIKKTMRTSKNP